MPTSILDIVKSSGATLGLYSTNTLALSLSSTTVSTSLLLSSTNTTASTSSITGAFKLDGGIGISNATDATSSTNGGSFTTAGGMAIAKNLFIGGGVLVGETSIAGERSFIVQNTNAGVSSYAIIRLANDTINNAVLFLNSSTSTTGDGAANGVVFRNDAGELNLQSSGGIGLNIASGGVITAANTTASTSSTIGAFKLAGGLSISNSTNSTSSTNGGSFTTAGGMAITQKLYVGTDINVGNLTESQAVFTDGSKNLVSVATTGSGSVVLAISPTLVTPVLGIASATSLDLTGTTASTSSTTGVLTLDGGIGIGNATDATSITNGGSFTTAGGMAVSKALYVGTNINLNSLTASQAVFTDGSKNLVSVATTGSGNVVLASSPTLVTPVLGIASATSLDLTGTTSSTSTTTGTLTIDGGFATSLTTDSASSSNGGSCTLGGGLGVGGNAYFGKSIVIGQNGVYTNGSIYSDVNWGILIRAAQVSPTLGHFSFADTNDTKLFTIATNKNIGIGDDLVSPVFKTSIYYAGNNDLSTTPYYNFGMQIHNTNASGTNNRSNLILFTDGSSTQAGIGGYRRNNDVDSKGGLLFLVGSEPIGFTAATPVSTTQASNSLTEAARITDSGILQINGTIASTSSATGILILAGGLGISNATDASSFTNGGSLTTAGGVAIAKKLYVGNDVFIGSGNPIAGPRSLIIQNSNSGTTSYSSINLMSDGIPVFIMFLNSSTRADDGGVNTATIRNDAGTLRLQSSGASGLSITGGVVSGNNTTASTSSGTGGMILAGGLGISNSTNATSSTNGGSLTTAGGIAAAGNIYTGQSIVVGQNGVYEPGAFYSDSNWGMIIRARQAAPGIAQFNFVDSNGSALMYLLGTGNIQLFGTTASTNSGTGSIITPGGIGISNTTDSSSFTNGGTFTTAGGAAIAKRLFIGGDVSIGTGNNIAGARSLILENKNSGSTSLSIMYLNNDTSNSCMFFLNSSTRSADGGVNTATIRNDAGELRLQSNGGTGLVVAASTGAVTAGTTLTSIGNLTGGGFDFVLGNTDQVTRGNSGNSRAMIKDVNSVLRINYLGDFTGGTQINSNLKIDGHITTLSLPITFTSTTEVYGDSISTNAFVSANQIWHYLVNQNVASITTIINNAISGYFTHDHTTRIYNQRTLGSATSTFHFIGTNDIRKQATTFTSGGEINRVFENSIGSVEAGIVYCALQSANLFNARGATETGTWVNTPAYTSVGRGTSTNGSTSARTVTGRFVAFTITATNPFVSSTYYGESFNVSITNFITDGDGTNGTFTLNNVFTSHEMTAGIVASWSHRCFIFDTGVVNGSHTITLTHPSNNGDVFYVDWYAGWDINTSFNTTMVLGIPPWNYRIDYNGDNTALYQNDERRIIYNKRLREVCTKLRTSYNMPVYYVDTSSPTVGGLTADGLHPSFVGQKYIANRVLSVITNGEYNYI